MADCCSPTFLFVLIRAVHYIACLLLLAVWAFDRLVLPAMAGVVPSSFRERWQILETRWTLLILPVIAISGVAWFVQLCVNMSGLPLADAMHADTLRAVWSQTNFGRVWQVRSILWLGWLYVPISLSLRMPQFFRSVSAWTNLVLAGALAASLAWAGHGQDGGAWHLLADAIHLFTAGLWPIGLAPLALLLFELRKLPPNQRRACTATVIFRFSSLSLVAVGLLAASGVVNSVYLVGSFGDLIGTPYGKVLLFKFALFVTILYFAAVNRLRLRPRLMNAPSEGEADRTAQSLRWNVSSELALGLIVLIVTAALGLMAPGHG